MKKTTAVDNKLSSWQGNSLGTSDTGAWIGLILPSDVSETFCRGQQQAAIEVLCTEDGLTIPPPRSQGRGSCRRLQFEVPGAEHRFRHPRVIPRGSPALAAGVLRAGQEPHRSLFKCTWLSKKSNLAKEKGRWEKNSFLLPFTSVCRFSIWAGVVQCSRKVSVKVSSLFRHSQ